MALASAGKSGAAAVASARYKVKSLGRALDALDIVGKRGREGMSLSELARALGMSKPATYAILQTFLAHGMVKDTAIGASRRYRLGMMLARLGDLAVANFGMVEVALTELRGLTETLALTSRLAIFDDGHAVVVGRVDGPGAIRFDAALGRRELPHCTAVGKALLAHRPREEVKAILKRLGMERRTPRTITTLAALNAELEEIRRKGYAIDDEEDSEGITCIASCITDRTGAVAGAISVTGLKRRDWSDRKPEIAAVVKACAARISRQLGDAD